MAAALLPDPLWDVVEPFLPTPSRRSQGGRPRISDRACLTGILFVLRSDIPWQMLPQELGCGSGMTCWRRLRDWQLAGVWDLIHFATLDWLARYGCIDWSKTVVDSCSIRAVYGGDQTGPNSTDRTKRGSKRHVICDRRGVPLAIRLTAAHRNDSQEALALVDAIPLRPTATVPARSRAAYDAWRARHDMPRPQPTPNRRRIVAAIPKHAVRSLPRSPAFAVQGTEIGLDTSHRFVLRALKKCGI
jgi:transposase